MNFKVQQIRNKNMEKVNAKIRNKNIHAHTKNTENTENTEILNAKYLILNASSVMVEKLQAN